MTMASTEDDMGNGEGASGFNTNEDDKGNDDEVEIHASVNEEDMLGLDVGDGWDDEEKDRPRRRSWDRTRGRERRVSRDREKDQNKDRERERERERERDKDRERDRDVRGRRRSRSFERRDTLNRRDPNKSTKDIEQDKLKTKKDNEDKILAEKEKAIKTLLDSDTVVPPGTEGEAIQILTTNKQEDDKNKKSSENRKRSRTPVRNRLGRRSPPRRSPPRRFSPNRRRSPSPDFRRRRRSPLQLNRRSDDKDSPDRRLEARRRMMQREKPRRSRSFDRRDRRSRSRSLERRRRSRSPFDRRRDRRRSHSRSPVRSPNRARRRSPFINELARQFQSDSSRPENSSEHTVPRSPMGSMQNMGPGAPPPYLQPGSGVPPGVIPGPPQQFDPRILPGVPSGMIPPAGGMLPTGPGMPMDIIPGPVMHPGGIMGPHGSMPNAYVNFDGIAPVPGVNFDPLNRGPPPSEYSSNPVLYQGAPLAHSIQDTSPQPVPAPGLPPAMYPMQSQPGYDHPHGSNSSYRRQRSPSPVRNRSRQEERMKTPEPPIISDYKPSEKASLSSLLEASVTSKDMSSSGTSSMFRGFKPEIIRQCERALRSLPTEDPRLKMKGRFFFDPTKKEAKKEVKESGSNSILIRKGRTEIFWDEEENQMSASSEPQQPIPRKKRVITLQKICQTESPTKGDVGIQAEAIMTDFCMQVGPQDLMSLPEEKPRDFDVRRAFDLGSMANDRRGFDEKRGFGDLRANFDERRDFDDRRGFDDNRGFDERRGFDLDRRNSFNDDRRLPNDRLDWSMRETFDHSAKLGGDSSDLRWSLNNQVRDKPINVSWGSAPQNNFGTNDNLLGLISGAVGGASALSMTTGIEGPTNVLDNFLRQEIEVRRGFDTFGPRNMDSFGSRNMDNRAGDMDNFGSRMDGRGGDTDKFGSRNMDSRSGDKSNWNMELFGFGNNMDRMMDARERLMDRSKGNKDVRDRNMGDGNESRGNFNKNSVGMNRDRVDKPMRGDSPKMDDNDDLEIIEERVPEQSWKNAKGGGGPPPKKTNVAKRGFRGRLGGYRP